MNETNPHQKIGQIPVKDLTVFHTIQLEDGSWQRIKSINRGMISVPATFLIDFMDGRWGNIPKNDKANILLFDFGFDTGSKSWIIGHKTERGTIAKAIEFYDSAKEAEEACKKLNGTK